MQSHQHSHFYHVGWSPFLNSAFDAYQFGTNPAYANMSLYENDTLLYFEVEGLELYYRFDFESFNVFKYLPTEITWTPVAFLVDNLANPFVTDNTTASSGLFLPFNRIASISSIFQNDDPFFLTLPTPDPDSYFYYAGRPIATIACRERYELEINPPDAPVNDTWIVAGSFRYVYNMSTTYEPLGQDVDLASDWFLLEFGINPSALLVMYSALGVDVLNAQKTLLGGVQYSAPQNISTRTEVTRWFGVAMLYLLNGANVLTSGTDNDWGFGITPFSDAFYFCDKTLRMSTHYVSVYLGALFLLLLGAAFIAAIAHWLGWLLTLVSRLFRKSSARRIRDAIEMENFHSVLQLHRLFVEATSEQRLTSGDIPIVQGRGSGIAPRYGAERIRRWQSVMKATRVVESFCQIGWL